MNEKNSTMAEESTVSMRDLFWYILRNGKKVLIVMLVCSVLLGLYSGVNSFFEMQAQQNRAKGAAVTDTEGKTNYIAQHPDNVTVAPKETATFTVSVNGEVSKYQWQYSEDDVTWKNVAVKTYPSAATEKLSFTAQASQNSYSYRCSVTFSDESKEISESATLTVTAGYKLITTKDVVLAFLMNLIIGAFFGLLAGAFFLAVRFVTKGYFANAQALEQRYDLPGLGIYPSEKNRGIYRKIMDRMTYRPDLSQKESVKLIIANLNLTVEENMPVYLTGTVSDKVLERLCELLQPRVKAQLGILGNVNEQAEAVEQLGEGMQIVCVEKILGSKLVYVDQEIKTIARSGARCCGFILIE